MGSRMLFCALGGTTTMGRTVTMLFCASMGSNSTMGSQMIFCTHNAYMVRLFLFCPTTMGRLLLFCRTTMAALLLFCPTTMGSSMLFCTSMGSTGVVVVFACTTLTCDQAYKEINRPDTNLNKSPCRTTVFRL